jgi:hypothetical protein
VTEDEYQTFIQRQRTEGKAAVRQMGYDLRRQVFGRYPDPIDKAMTVRFSAKAARLAEAFRLSGATAKITMDAVSDPFRTWQATDRIAMSVIHPNARVVLSGSLT